MKNTFLHYIKITLALVLFLQVGEVSGQSFVNWTLPTTTGPTPITGTFTGGTVTVSQGTTGSSINFNTTTNNSNLNGALSSQSFRTDGPTTTPPSKSLIFTFSTPVIINELNLADIDQQVGSWDDSFTFSGITFTSATGVNCTATVTGANATTSVTGPSSLEYAQWLTSTTPVSSFRIDFKTVSAVTHAVLYYAMKVTNACTAGTTAPTLSATTINNSSCATPYVNLNSLVTSTLPTGASLVWYTNNAHTGNPVLDPTKVATSGTYYAFYFDAVNNCYSPASAAVTATYTVCPLAIATTCPTVSVDLASRVQDAAPAGYIYTYHTGTPAAAGNKLTSSVVTTSGTYYVGTYATADNCYTATSRPIGVTITNCCANIAPAGVN